MLLCLRLLSDRGFADGYDQRLYRCRVDRQLLLRASVYAKHYAELVEVLFGVAL